MPSFPLPPSNGYSDLSVSVPDDVLWVRDGGLNIGRTQLLSPSESKGGRADRLEALLAIAFWKRFKPEHLKRIVDAISVSRSGDEALANLRLSMAGLSPAPAADGLSDRMSTATALMDSGTTPDALMRALDLDVIPDGRFTKYDPEQPRVPAGSGDESGRWTIASTIALAARAAPLLAPGLGGVALAGLEAFVAVVGFGAVGGVLFVPWQNSVSSSGDLPGNDGTTYDYNHDTGFLGIRDRSGELLAGGHRDNRSGVFFDARTGVPFAREVKGALVFDGAAMAEADVDDDAKAETRADRRSLEEEQEPRLCPDPGPDQPGSEAAKKRAREYQEQISRMINPHRPLPYGLAMNLVNPWTGKTVHYDECDEKSGTMIEAKGPGFNGLLSFPQGIKGVEEKWRRQSFSNVQAAGSRQVVWYFAERYAADHAKQFFAKEGGGRERIVVKVQPAENS